MAGYSGCQFQASAVGSQSLGRQRYLFGMELLSQLVEWPEIKHWGWHIKTVEEIVYLGSGLYSAAEDVDRLLAVPLLLQALLDFFLQGSFIAMAFRESLAKWSLRIIYISIRIV